ncbi:hypothetical protein T4E_8840 [Trichinella pseudospiralis]|uniref:Homeobox domain-containing protein n=1 Tax=Trichinella pseudospiralis TaxID=6337 RepID=A0A0V0XGS8_TRIPS|nr:hypothetical protein T4E_8840 [Trichinella pseudospiralis]
MVPETSQTQRAYRSLLLVNCSHLASYHKADGKSPAEPSTSPNSTHPTTIKQCPKLKMIIDFSSVWFQNRRAKYRKQEKQLQKALAPPVLPTHCNGPMMRNMYAPPAIPPRGYQPYSVAHTGMPMSMANRSTAYQPAPAANYPTQTTHFNMAPSMANACDPDDWYSKSLNALRMTPSHGLSGPIIHYQT